MFKSKSIDIYGESIKIKDYSFFMVLLLTSLFTILLVIASGILSTVMLFKLPHFLRSTNLFSPAMADSMLLLDSNIGILIIFPLFVRYFDKVSIKAMGLRTNHIFKDYFSGVLMGILMLSIVCIILYLGGYLELKGIDISGYTLLQVMLVSFAWMVQSAGEEFVTRGFMLHRIGTKNIPVAIIISSVFFGAAHLGNASIDYLAILNIVLVGLCFSIYAVKSDNILGACGMHFAWNYFQGPVFGIAVSGNTLATKSIMTLVPAGNEIISGGAFGVEASILTSIIIIIVCGLMYKYGEKLNFNKE